MKAVVFHRTGEPSTDLKVVEMPEPQITQGTALVEVFAGPVHPADIAFVRGQYRIRPRFPQVAGLEGVGVVLATSSKTGIKAGTRVAFRWLGSFVLAECSS